ncbi:hypothetical protein Nepgr_007091 [Nepenthes gracilis]|uniref:HECT-type E3 ubiquitin transferase n=1 Tax=Nepenthes gracilis TaxID=150966 RepID=A0AAD3XI70_NEPGR|nr:hypothetical protein Nepgr_007091 [Nepenthes gracilis]
MSVVDISIHQRVDHRLPPKRKLEDFSPIGEDDDVSDLGCFIRMRKLDHPQIPASQNLPNSEGRFDDSTNSLHDPKTFIRGESSCLKSGLQLQFFVRMISGGNTLVLRANLDDTVEMVHKMIQSITGIPVTEQRLIYRGKQLQWEQKLVECSIQNDAGLQLVGRMRSTSHPDAWRVINEMLSLICQTCKNYSLVCADNIKGKLNDYVARIPNGGREVSEIVEYLKVFMDSNAEKALVMLYMSPEKNNKHCADGCIRKFINSVDKLECAQGKAYGAAIVLEFCRLLRSVDDDLLYVFCRNALGSIVKSVGLVVGGWTMVYNFRHYVAVEDILPYFEEVAKSLAKDLVLSVEANASVGPLLKDVIDFSAFCQPLRSLIWEQVQSAGCIAMPFLKGTSENFLPYGEVVELLFGIYTDLFGRIDECLGKMEESRAVKEQEDGDTCRGDWSQYLAILKELNSIAGLFEGAEVQFWNMMKRRRVLVRVLIVRYAKRCDDHEWLFKHKDVMDFESRRHLAMLMFPEVKEDFEELHEMLIDRSQLLTESFEYISRADRSSLHAGLFMEFKNEEATGPGVLREWFFLVCQAVFNPQNALFVPCPHDRRRFFPNPASKVDPMHLKYFHFSGRVIALALMHKVQVGIALDQAFFFQLAGRDISLEDIKDADPYMYNSCKQILDMDAEIIDSDALGLTFVREVEELGSRKIVELCDGGKSIVVNSNNREMYINLLIQNRFVTSVTEQVNQFAQGFADILCSTAQRKFFFQSLELEDLDFILHGSLSAISIEDWKAHTEYNGYKKSDPQMLWFWEVVEEMSAKQKNILLFFWTSLKYLPVEGFRGLASRLFIYKSLESPDRLPSSHTCFYRLCLPTYPSIAVMRERLAVIAQEHVGCSFGTW